MTGANVSGSAGDLPAKGGEADPEPSRDSVATDEFDRFVGGLDYPVFVVTTAHRGAQAGCLVGFTTQVSIHPPRLLVCLSVQNRTYDVARHAPMLAVHLLPPSRHELAELFGGETGDEVDKFSRCCWRPGPGGVPLLEDCDRRMVGRVIDRHPLGDHVGFLLEPVAVDTADTDPGLTLEQVRDVDAGHPA